MVLAWVISVKGSTPREVSASTVIRRKGEIAGTVGRIMQSGLLSEVFNNPVNHEIVPLVNLKELHPGYLFT